MVRWRDGPDGKAGAPVELRVHIREANMKDLPAVSWLERDLFPGAALPGFAVRQLYDLFGRFFLVAAEGNRPRGYVIGGISLQSAAWVLSIAVDHDYRGLGLGKKLLEGLLKRMEEAGVPEVFLTVKPENRTAIGLFESEGFSAVAREPEYFGEGEERVVMLLEPRGAEDNSRRARSGEH